MFEIPEDVFSSYHKSKLGLVDEIATFIDLNIADRILIDWFVQDPDAVALPLTQIHFNSLINRPQATTNPYIPKNCGDGVIYTDGFKTSSHILVTDINSSHASLLDVESPKGQILQKMQVGETIDDSIIGQITLLERLPPYVAAFRLAIELRDKGNDGTDVFKSFSMPSNEDDFIPYFEKILRSVSFEDKDQISSLNNPDLPLVMRGKFTNPDCPVKGAIKHLTSKDSTQYMSLFNDGIETPDKVIIDIYTAVYFSMLGLVSSLNKLSIVSVSKSKSPDRRLGTKA